MLGRRRPTAPSNDSVVAVPYFTPDDRGAAIFHSVTAAAAGHLNGTPPMITPESWHGWTAPAQLPTTGLAGIGGRAITGPHQTYDQAQIAASTPVQRILEDRMARGLQ